MNSLKKVLYFPLTVFLLLDLFSCSLSPKLPNIADSPGAPRVVSRSEAAISNSKPGVIIAKDASKFRNVYAISDVHGMFQQAVTLLQAAKVIDSSNNWIAENSLLVIIGDSIDKGPQSLEVLDLWIQLQQQAVSSHGQVVHVLGNHEAEFLASPQGDSKAAELLAELKAKNIPISDLTSANTLRGQFLHQEPLALVVGQWLFCHSGYYPDMTWDNFTSKSQELLQAGTYSDDFIIGDSSILEAKDWEKNESSVSPVLARLDSIGIFGDVFGHQPGAFKIKGRSAAKYGGRLIKIDNGLPLEGGSHPGSILVFANPTQMNSKIYPEIQVIGPDGKPQLLIPE